MDLSSIHEGEPVACELRFEVMPEVELPDIESMEVERLRTIVTDEMVDRLVRHVRKENAEVRPVDRPVGNDDLVDVDLVIHVLEPMGYLSEPRREQIDLFDEMLRQEIRSALVGKSKGDMEEAVFRVEEGHEDKRFAGKELSYAMTIQGVSEYVLPELNEEFYKKLFGEDTDIHTEEDFRNKLRADLTSTMERENANNAELRALMAVTRGAKVDVPDTLINRQVQALRRADEREAKEHYGSDLRGVLGRDNEDWEKGYMGLLRLRAESMVRQSLVVDAIGKKYDVNVEKEDIDAELDRRAGLYKTDKNVLMGFLYKNQNALDQLVDDVRYSKITSLLLTKVRVKDVDELTPEQPETSETQTPEAQEGNPQPEQPQPEGQPEQGAQEG